jgi:ABC-2 type transport system permease protein
MNALKFFRLLFVLNLQIVRRNLLELREKSLLMVSVITLFVAGYWFAGYAIFYMGFHRLAEVPGLQVIVLDRMLYLFFAFLFLMLMFSNMIIGYSTLFKSQETQWMLTLPVRSIDVFRWKLMETTLLASWAFLFLSAPLMAAYGNARHVSPTFYLKVFLLFVPFTVIPAALGSIAILIVTRYLHRRVFKWALFGVSAVGIAAGVTFLKPMQAEQLGQAQMVASLTQLLHNCNLTLQPMLPSYWVASSTIAWGEGWSGKGLFYFLVLLSNAMMATLVCVTISRRLFYEGWSRNHTQGEFQLGVPLLDKPINLPRAALADRIVNLWPRMHHATRALVIKDIRVFWRDTSQWSQFVIFFGLLGLYVLNLRSVAYDSSNEHYWATFVCFLNLGASSMTLATLTTRFVFPQFSLEGKRLWIVGMVPNGLKLVLLEKFWLSSVCSATITLCLMLGSSWMLRIPGWLTLLFASTVVVMSFALCGIAVGIGALFPNFSSGSTVNRRDDNPARIVSGFGGTFCFLLSLVYLVLVIGSEVLPMYLSFTPNSIADRGQSWGLVVSWIFVAFLSFAATTIPMSLALKKIESLEI